MEKHVTLVSALHIGFGVLGFLIALIVFTAVVGGGVISGDPEAITITTIVGTSIASFIIIKSLPSIIGGIGLLKYKPWARVLILIVGCLDLFEIPVGTAIGIYSIWVLLNDETALLFGKKPTTKKT